MNKKDIVNALIGHYSSGSKSQFANFLGVKPQTISTWIARESFDIELIYSKCEHLNPHWLLTGEGEMLRNPSEVPQNAPDTTIDRLLAKITEQAETIGALKEQIRQLQREKGKDASYAQTSGVANAG